MVFRRAGGASPLAWLLAGLICTLVGLCFAEAAGRTDRSGGPYRYACDAFGMRVGFAVGWITVVSSILGFAAVARGFADHAAVLAGTGGAPVVIAVSAAVLVFGLSALNIRGVKPSARLSDGIGFVKIAGLIAFVMVGLWYGSGHFLRAPAAPEPGETVGLGAAAYAGMFALTGFEYVPVPAGETENPQRAVALAVVVSLIGATGLYALVQVAAIESGAPLAGSHTPLVDAAGALLGSTAATAVTMVALISAFGFCSGSALVVPRYLESFANDGFLPSLLGRRSPSLGTPVPAILCTALLVAPLAAVLQFRQLADISMVAVIVQYVSTCLAVPVLRYKNGPSPRFRLPLGPLIPLAGAAASFLFFFSVATTEILVTAAMLAGGIAIATVTRMLAKPRT